MDFKKASKELKKLLTEILMDLESGDSGNRSAQQRVRTKTILLNNSAKIYRKVSIEDLKDSKLKK